MTYTLVMFYPLYTPGKFNMINYVCNNGTSLTEASLRVLDIANNYPEEKIFLNFRNITIDIHLEDSLELIRQRYIQYWGEKGSL